MHCAQGKSRSSAVAAAFLAAFLGLTAAEALELLRTRRAMAEPNPGFRAQLEVMGRAGFFKRMGESWRRAAAS